MIFVLTPTYKEIPESKMVFKIVHQLGWKMYFGRNDSSEKEQPQAHSPMRSPLYKTSYGNVWTVPIMGYHSCMLPLRDHMIFELEF